MFGYIILFLNVAITLYLYLFGVCPEHTLKYIWIFILSLSLIPVFIYFIIHYYEYDEKKKNKELMGLLDTHKLEIEKLLEIENSILVEIEEELIDKLAGLSSQSQYVELFKDAPQLNKLYSILITLTEEYKQKSNPINIEESLIEIIDLLLQNKIFIILTKKDKQISFIYSRLKLLFEQYESKQEIYEKVDELIKERNDMKTKLKKKNNSLSE